MKNFCFIAFALSCITFIVVPGSALSVGEEMVLPASSFKQDGKWESKGWCRHGYRGKVYVVHKPAKNGVKGEMKRTFPGPSGVYDVGLGTHAKCNGRAPWEVWAGGKKIGSGMTPWAKTKCDCKGYGDDCVPYPGGVAKGVKINAGDEIKYVGTIKWHECGQGGVYAGWYQLMFTLKSKSDGGDTPGDPPVQDPPAQEDIDFSAKQVKLNFGSGDVSGWHDASGFVQGGEAFTFSGETSTDGIDDAAPAQVYNSVYHRGSSTEPLTILLPDVAKGVYTLRFHVTDAYGDRAMDISAEGKLVIEDLDPVTAGGGEMKAVVKEAAVTVADANGLEISLDDDRAEPKDVFLSGLEIIAGTTPKKTGVAPGLRAGLSPETVRPATVRFLPDGRRVRTTVQGVIIEHRAGDALRSRILVR